MAGGLQLYFKPTKIAAPPLHPHSACAEGWMPLNHSCFGVCVLQVLCVNIVQADTSSACSSFPRTHSTHHQRNLHAQAVLRQQIMFLSISSARIPSLFHICNLICIHSFITSLALIFFRSWSPHTTHSPRCPDSLNKFQSI